MLSFRPRYLRRYRKIADVLVRHGFGAIVAQLGLDQALDLRRRLEPVKHGKRSKPRFGLLAQAAKILQQ
jgi:hypothetical protein